MNMLSLHDRFLPQENERMGVNKKKKQSEFGVFPHFFFSNLCGREGLKEFDDFYYLFILVSL